MSSTEWSNAQLHLFINERKQRNAEYHATPNKKKQYFWDNITNKLNEQENTNFFLSKICQNKFSSLTKAFNTAKRYREGTGTKKSLVGRKYTKSFQRCFELSFDQQHNESVRRKSGTSSSSRSSISRSEQISDIADLFETSPPVSRPVMPSVEGSAISRPTTPTLPSFSQSANVINVTINYSGGGDSKGISSNK
ncbi:hypothetical protein RclHR1_06910002 [Rhizophagus clarus]|uniref:Myb/SANT-like DNA-binding domain-containing protein n=1 Tax=Rhizophagus clarus TaxID=94130 RepID=A0A2Z6S6U4_9GLOM|nr:hypothetical protein RclHR1_06910002 [Rhizophagus clarus]GES96810.1 hypothetical protein GLOIN_2v1488880 [Rhizophagus clarus]